MLNSLFTFGLLVLPQAVLGFDIFTLPEGGWVEGAYLDHLKFLGNKIHVMTKSTFYFVTAVLSLTNVGQGRYQKKLAAEKMPKANIA